MGGRVNHVPLEQVTRILLTEKLGLRKAWFLRGFGCGFFLGGREAILVEASNPPNMAGCKNSTRCSGRIFQTISMVRNGFSTQGHFAEGCLGDALVCQCTFLFVCARWTYAQQKSSGVTENLDLPGQENLHQLYSSICQTETYCTWNYFIYCILLSKKMECLGMSIIGIIHKLKSQRVQTFWKDANFVRFLLKQFVGPIFITGMFSAPLQSPLWMVHHYKARSSPSDLKCVRPRWFLSQQRQLAEQNDLVLWNMWHPERGVVFMILGGGWTTHLKDMIVKLDPQFSGRKFQKHLSCHHLGSYFYSILLIFLFGRLAYIEKPYHI